MKQFEPIVIQESDWEYHEKHIESAVAGYGTHHLYIIESNERGEELQSIALSEQAAIRLRDALNTILND